MEAQIEATIVPFDRRVHLQPVLDLLATSLPSVAGERFFSWKHLESPFGPSPGYLAYLNDRLVGVRFFLKWEFILNQAVLKGLRPVDTVTHPDARGMGVFKKLTLHGLEREVTNHRPIIFNTPNGNSLPGYLKMGWQRYPTVFRYQYRLANPFISAAGLTVSDYPSQVPVHRYPDGMVCTHRTEAFIQWRYGFGDYRFAQFNGDPTSLLIFSVATRSGMKFLNVVDFVGDAHNLSRLVHAAAKRVGARFFREIQSENNGGTPLKLVRGTSIVAIRAENDLLSLPFQFSLGDLQDTL